MDGAVDAADAAVDADAVMPLPISLQPPPVERLFHFDFLFPLVTYFIFFRLASLYVKQNIWQDFKGFKQYRLQNLTICLLHAIITGLWSVLFFLTHKEEMFTDVIDWYQYWAAQLPIISVAYFIQDALDMMQYEWNRYTVELLFHHIATCVALTTGVLPNKYLLCDYWALLMEANSIFLHIRTIMQISGKSQQEPETYRFIIRCNIITFVVFRFVAQAFFVQWALDHYHRMHTWYILMGLVGPGVFFVINVMLFFRLIVADGYLGERWKDRAAINRDSPAKTNGMRSTSLSNGNAKTD